MSTILLTGERYKVDSLYQWDVNQDLKITGLSLSFKPEIHFTNKNMDRAIVKQSEMDDAGVIIVKIPNSLLQVAAPISVYVCGYENDTFKTYYAFVIPVCSRVKPADYILIDDPEVYSFENLEYKINNFNNAVLENVKSWICNNLAAIESGYILDARQGKVLLDRIVDEETKVGSLQDLETENKNSIVQAINSIIERFDNYLGKLTDLKTTITNTIVGAINSLKSAIDTHKESADHDERYYTEDEIDNKVNDIESGIQKGLESYYTKDQVNQLLESKQDTIKGVPVIVDDIVNDLESADGGKPLSAYQGKVLNDKIQVIGDRFASVNVLSGASIKLTFNGQFSALVSVMGPSSGAFNCYFINGWGSGQDKFTVTPFSESEKVSYQVAESDEAVTFNNAGGVEYNVAVFMIYGSAPAIA